MEYTASRHKKEFEIEKTRQGVPKLVICNNYRAFEKIIKLYLMINETILVFIGVEKIFPCIPLLIFDPGRDNIRYKRNFNIRTF